MSTTSILLNPGTGSAREAHPGPCLVALLDAGTPYLAVVDWVDSCLAMSNPLANDLAVARYDDEDERTHLDRVSRQVIIEVPVLGLPHYLLDSLPAPLHVALARRGLRAPGNALAVSPDYRDQVFAVDRLMTEEGRPIRREDRATAAALARSPYDFARIHAAGCTATPEEVLAVLAADPDPLVRAAVAGNQAATVGVADVLEAHRGTRTRGQGAALRARLRTTQPQHGVLRLTGDAAVAEFAAAPTPHEPVLDRIAAFPDRRHWHATCLALAANPKTPDTILYSLAHTSHDDAPDGDLHVALAANVALASDTRGTLAGLAPDHRRREVERALERVRGY